MFDIVGIGECVVDMTPAGESEKGNALFERQPGGAPSNMLACQEIRLFEGVPL